MLKHMTYADRQKIVEAQKLDLAFDWLSDKTSDVQKRVAVADTIYELVTREVEATNPLPAIFTTVRGEAGKKIKAGRNYGGRVYERSYGEYKKISHFKAKYYTMTTTPKSLHISYPIEELAAGITTVSELSQQAANAILFHKVKTVWDTLKAACPTGGDYCTDVGLVMVDQASLDTALSTFGDRYEIAGIFGRRAFLDGMFVYSGNDRSTGYPDSVKEDLINRGLLMFYRGAPILAMREIPDELYGASAMDAANAFIVAKDNSFNRYVEVTPLRSSNEVIKSDNTFHMYFDFEDGYAIWEPKYVHRLNNGA